MINLARQPRGHGHEFEKRFTSLDKNLPGSTSHHRIVRYNLGGIECVVRFEVDAFFEEKIAQTAPTDESVEPGLVDTMAKVTLEPSSAPGIERKVVKVIPGGQPVDSSTILELKCKKEKIHKYGVREFLPQLWISQTRYLAVAPHTDGKISKEVQPDDLSSKLAQWEIDNQIRLRKLIGVIKEIKSASRNFEGGKCTIIYEKGLTPKCLQIYDHTGGHSVIRPEVKARFWG